MRYSAIAYRLAYGFVYAGLFFAQSKNPFLWNYSIAYVVILVVLAAGFFAPELIGYTIRKFGARSVALSSAISLLALALVYVVASNIYYHTRTYPFHAFLQVHPPSISIAETAQDQPSWRILALGGSTTRNAILDVPDRYPEHLETLLNGANDNKQVRVLNAGMDWYTSRHTLINYATNTRDLKPNVVLVMHGINDLYRSCTPKLFAAADYQPDWSHFYGPASRGAFPPTFERFFYTTFFSPLAWHWYRPFRLKEVDYGMEHYRSLPDFEKNMTRLVETLKNDNVQVVLLTQPSLFKKDMSSRERGVLVFGREFCGARDDWFFWTYPSASSMAQAMQAYNDVTRRIAREQGVPLIEGEKEIPKDLDHFTDDVHYTPAGSRRLAALVAQELRRLGLHNKR